METFSLLKYWRNGAGVANMRAAPKRAASAANVRTTTTTTIATSALRSSTESDDEDEYGEGSFFDLEFDAQNDGETSESCDDEDQAEEVNLTVSSSASSSSSTSDPSISLSPAADDIFFKGEHLPLEPSIVDLESKPSQIISNSLIKSATKPRVFMLNLKKPNKSPQSPGSSNKTQPRISSKFFIKFKVEEVPIVSLFTRESSSKKASKTPKSSEAEPTIAVASAEEMKKFSKETVQRYINKIKPLYVRVSKRYREKLRFSGMLTAADGPTFEADVAKVKVPAATAGLRVARKRLGKSKSAPPAMAALAASTPLPAIQQRRDDSLLQQQDGIQSAIAHCKRSFDVAATNGSQSPLVRSKSDPSDDRSGKGIKEGDQS